MLYILWNLTHDTLTVIYEIPSCSKTTLVFTYSFVPLSFGTLGNSWNFTLSWVLPLKNVVLVRLHFLMCIMYLTFLYKLFLFLFSDRASNVLWVGLTLNFWSLPLPPKCYEQRHALPWQFLCSAKDWTKGFLHARQALFHRATSSDPYGILSSCTFQHLITLAEAITAYLFTYWKIS